MASDSELDSSSMSNSSEDSEDDEDISFVKDVAGRKRPHSEDNDTVPIPGKVSPNLLISFSNQVAQVRKPQRKHLR